MLPQYLDRLLARCHPLYTFLMRQKPGWNREKYVFAKLIKKGDVVFDIGANYGVYTRFYSYWVGAKGCVHAFEPIPPTFKVLEESCVGLSNVKLNRLALNNTEEKVRMYLPGDACGKASLAQHQSSFWNELGEPIEEFEVSTVTLDQYIKDNSIQHVDFMKIDVEGAELRVLNGSLKTLRQFQPILHIELNDDWLKDLNTTSECIVRLLHEINYDFIAAYDTDLKMITNISRILEQCVNAGINVIFANRAKHQKELSALKRCFL